MTASLPTKRLGKAVRAVTGNGDPGKVVALARKWGIGGRLARRAAKDIDVNASAYIKLCAAVEIDPASGIATTVACFKADIDWNRVATKILLALINGNKTMREAAKEWKISLVALARAKSQQPVNVDNFLKICAGLGCHPHEFTIRVPVAATMKQLVEQREPHDRISTS